MSKGRLAATLLAAATAAYVPAALAYVGPGAGLGMIASVFAMVLAFLATIVGIVLWPIRKLRQRGRKAAGGPAQPKGGGED
jgi:hypothetical protein